MHDWTEIVAEHGPTVWRTAYRLLGDATDAADCYQETLIDALRLAGQRPVENWSALLRRVATARAVDSLRRKMRRSRREEPTPTWHGMPDTAVGPAIKTETAELAEQARRALATLPQRQAEVTALRYLEDLSYEEIAACLGLRVGAVSVLLHKARRRLAQKLDVNSIP